MKPITPLPGFNVCHINSEQYSLRVCCVCHGAGPKQKWTGTWYCDACSADCGAYIKNLKPEGDAVVRAVRV
jgi:ribosomal protein L37AE/L43A